MFELERSVTATQSLWDREIYFPSHLQITIYQRAFSSPLQIQTLFPTDTRGNDLYKIFILKRGKDRSTPYRIKIKFFRTAWERETSDLFIRTPPYECNLVSRTRFFRSNRSENIGSRPAVIIKERKVKCCEYNACFSLCVKRFRTPSRVVFSKKNRLWVVRGIRSIRIRSILFGEKIFYII